MNLLFYMQFIPLVGRWSFLSCSGMCPKHLPGPADRLIDRALLQGELHLQDWMIPCVWKVSYFMG